MIPPKEYFEQVPDGTPGAQRVGPYWFAFISPDSLFDMINVGVFEESDESDEKTISNLEDAVSDLESENEDLGDQIDKLEEEIDELKSALEKQAEEK